MKLPPLVEDRALLFADAVDLFLNRVLGPAKQGHAGEWNAVLADFRKCCVGADGKVVFSFLRFLPASKSPDGPIMRDADGNVWTHLGVVDAKADAWYRHEVQ